MWNRTFSQTFDCSKQSRTNKTGTSEVGSKNPRLKKAQSFFKYAQDLFVKSSKNSFQTPKGCLSCSTRIGNHFFPTGNFLENSSLKLFSFGKCRIVPKNVKGGALWELLTYIQLQSIRKLEGEIWRLWLIFQKKVAQCRNKIEREDALVSSGFVGYVEKVKNDRGILCTKFPLTGLDFSCFSSFCKKRTFQCEVCGLKKKKVTVRVRYFSFKGKCVD